MKPVKLILASSSPRRKELLELTGLEFSVIHPECEEQVCCHTPEELVLELSKRKCMAGAELLRKLPENQDPTGTAAADADGCAAADLAGSEDPVDLLPEPVVLGADTIVCHNGHVLGKPKDPQEAFQMLRQLSGDTHSVYTGVTLYAMKSHKALSFYEKTDVTFYAVTEDEIRDYLLTKEPMDKAGAYGIQGRGAFLVRKIDGDYFTVVGLPVAQLMQALKEL